MSTPDGESVHSFLIGARYNRSNCIDSKALTKYGVFLSRSYPLSFLTQNSSGISKQDEEISGPSGIQQRRPPSGESCDVQLATQSLVQPTISVTPRKEGIILFAPPTIKWKERSKLVRKDQTRRSAPESYRQIHSHEIKEDMASLTISAGMQRNCFHRSLQVNTTDETEIHKKKRTMKDDNIKSSVLFITVPCIPIMKEKP
ncbi:uncharacterized protein LOC122801405 [Protopterus annectens]|uniref:uncharacterized protein LOC122801405 n=1 Tax=Protopterus annectens TaxID=7888 RepID=UPI001CFB7E05|nr:uncharacterized protein LOC122801405 [Protopterus annectens]